MRPEGVLRGHPPDLAHREKGMSFRQLILMNLGFWHGKVHTPPSTYTGYHSLVEGRSIEPKLAVFIPYSRLRRHVVSHHAHTHGEHPLHRQRWLFLPRTLRPVRALVQAHRWLLLK